MLASLLPGIRNLRTPLATGYIWLLTFWLWIPSNLKNSKPPTSGVMGDVALLVHYAGRVGIGVAISFVAYLVGVLSESVNFPFARLGTFIVYAPSLIYSRMREQDNWLGRLCRKLEKRRQFHDLWVGVTHVTKAEQKESRVVYVGGELRFSDFLRNSSFTRRGDSKEDDRDDDELKFTELDEKQLTEDDKELALTERVARATGQLSKMGLISLEDFSRQLMDEGKIDSEEESKFLSYLVREVPRQGNALVGKETELYSVYDRLISEYEFRVSIAVPLIVLIITLAVRWSPFWLLTLLPLLILLRTGSQQRIAAGDLLADAVRLRRVDIALPRDLAAASTLPAEDQDDFFG